jgi:hypothetical protein
VSEGDPPEPRIWRTADGRIAVRLAPREREILRMLAAELAQETEREADGVAEDQGLARLWPDAIEGDPEAAAAFRELTGADLDRERRARFVTVVETIGSSDLDEAQASAWLGVVNDLRLVRGTRLGVTEDTSAGPVDETDPAAGQTIVYLWLGWIEEELVEALASGLPEVQEPDAAT